ncbi:hypothetical protein YQE_01257, partial [Dendroctonus ponderosae]
MPLRLIPYRETNNTVIYLDAKITNKGSSEPEVKRSIGMAKKALGGLVKIWEDHNIRKMNKMRLLKALILSIATYGSETWTLHAACRKRIEE